MSDTNRARALRTKPTWAKKLMWTWLRDRRFSTYKFRRGHPVGIYFLDFYCREASLSIELDGGGHGFPEQQAHDAERTRFLASLGIKELRFWNSRLRRDKQAIRDTIFRELQMRAPIHCRITPDQCNRRTKADKKVRLTLALTLTLSPGERE